MTSSTSRERRLVSRVEHYWSSLCQGRAFARAVDIDPVELGDDWCDCFVINPSGPPEEAVFLFVGPNLLANAGLPEGWAREAERHVRDCPPDSMLGRSVCQIGRVLKQRTPAAVAETFEEDGVEVRLRGALFPLSSNGRDIDAVLGVANCLRSDDESAERPAA